MILETYIALYICAKGPSCPDKLIPSSRSWYSLETCRKEARLTAQGMYVSSGDRYNFECRRIDFEPEDLTK